MRSGVGYTNGGYRYPLDGDFFQSPQKAVKSNDIGDIELARDKK